MTNPRQGVFKFGSGATTLRGGERPTGAPRNRSGASELKTPPQTSAQRRRLAARPSVSAERFPHELAAPFLILIL